MGDENDKDKDKFPRVIRQRLFLRHLRRMCAENPYDDDSINSVEVKAAIVGETNDAAPDLGTKLQNYKNTLSSPPSSKHQPSNSKGSKKNNTNSNNNNTMKLHKLHDNSFFELATFVYSCQASKEE